MNLATMPAYVYIDASNIRNACRNSCGFNIDFDKLYAYLKKRYPGTQEIRYYEGIARGDKVAQGHFRHLRKVGYKVCTLQRKRYIDPARYSNYRCESCGAVNRVQILPENIKLKSNIDVYMASDMIEQVVKSGDNHINIILLSCDGDYVEAIKTIWRLNPRVHVTVLATPKMRKNNCLSIRLMLLTRKVSRKKYQLVNIKSVQDLIS